MMTFNEALIAGIKDDLAALQKAVEDGVITQEELERLLRESI